MDTKTLFAQGNLTALHEQVAQDIRQNPRDAASRALFAQVLCLEGEWERADKQANALMSLHPASAVFCSTLGKLIRAERRREAMFRADAPPTWFGEKPEWADLFAGALAAYAREGLQAGAEASARLTEALPETKAVLSRGASPWILDGDARLAGVLELLVGDTHGVVDLSVVRSMELAAPTHPVELLWAHVRLQLKNGEVMVGRMPGRYPLINGKLDSELLMMRSSAWTECGAGLYIGSGQRCWCTPEGLFPMLHEPLLRFDSGDENPLPAAAAKEP